MKDSYFEEIFYYREKNLKKRQQSFDREFAICKDILSRHGQLHPYVKSGDVYEDLMKQSFFANPTHGPNCVLEKPFLYSRSSFSKLFKSEHRAKGYYTDVVEDAFGFSRSIRQEKLYNSILQLYKAQNEEWVSLDYFFNEDLPLDRNFNWWTCEEMEVLDGKEVVDVLYRCGVPSDWFSKYNIILKYSVSDTNLDSIRIPTEIDALFSCIFRQRNFNEFPSTGKTIPLNEDTLNLNTYFREYIITNPKAQNIKMKPVIIDHDSYKSIKIQDVHEKLLNLYKEL